MTLSSGQVRRQGFFIQASGEKGIVGQSKFSGVYTAHGMNSQEVRHSCRTIARQVTDIRNSANMRVYQNKLLRLAGEVGQFCPPHGKQNGHYGRAWKTKGSLRPPKNRMSRNACGNRQFVPFCLIFVTRLLRNPAQIADLCAIFLHKTGLLCNILSASFTFWAVRREISGPEREIPSPGILFSGLGIFISGLV